MGPDEGILWSTVRVNNSVQHGNEVRAILCVFLQPEKSRQPPTLFSRTTAEMHEFSYGASFEDLCIPTQNLIFEEHARLYTRLTIPSMAKVYSTKYCINIPNSVRISVKAPRHSEPFTPEVLLFFIGAHVIFDCNLFNASHDVSQADVLYRSSLRDCQRVAPPACITVFGFVLQTTPKVGPFSCWAAPSYRYVPSVCGDVFLRVGTSTFGRSNARRSLTRVACCYLCLVALSSIPCSAYRLGVICVFRSKRQNISRCVPSIRGRPDLELT